jgi:hypothetical protein
LGSGENKMIETLPDIPITQRLKLPECHAVYFVLDNDHRVHYIGATINLRQRWQNHKKLKLLSNPNEYRIAWLEVHPDYIRATEDQLISGLCPPLNGYGLATERRRALGMPEPTSVRNYFATEKPKRQPRKRVKCFSCDYQWRPLSDRPVLCARCHSPEWDNPNARRYTPFVPRSAPFLNEDLSDVKDQKAR